MGNKENIENAQKALIKKLTYIRNATNIEVFNKLVQDSPYGDPPSWKNKPPPGYHPGHFRANWQISRRNPATKEINSTTLIPSAEHINAATLNETIYLVNNAPYAQRLEEGWSKQRGAGWIARIMSMGSAIMAKLAGEIK